MLRQMPTAREVFGPPKLTGPPSVAHDLVQAHVGGYHAVPLFGFGVESASSALAGCQRAAREGVPICALEEVGSPSQLERTVGDGHSRSARVNARRWRWALRVFLVPVNFTPQTMQAFGYSGSEISLDLPDDAPLVIPDINGRGNALLVYGAHSIRLRPLSEPSSQR